MSIENELMHHGILGMKWGVRRKVGSDGRVNSVRKQQKISSYKEKLMRGRGQDSADAAARKSREDYEDLKENGINTKWFKREYPDEATAQDLFGMSRKELYKDELKNAKYRAAGSAFTAKHYDKMVNQKIRDIDISSATKREVYKIYRTAYTEYTNAFVDANRDIPDN